MRVRARWASFWGTSLRRQRERDFRSAAHSYEKGNHLVDVLWRKSRQFLDFHNAQQRKTIGHLLKTMTRNEARELLRRGIDPYEK